MPCAGVLRSMYNRYPQSGPGRQHPALLGQVLGITGVGFLITALSSYLFRGVSPLVGHDRVLRRLRMLFIMSAVRRNPQVALLWFYAFTFVEGVGLAPMITRYVRVDGPDVVVNAAATTGFGMLVLGGVAFTFSVDWRRFQGIAFGALIALVVVGIARCSSTSSARRLRVGDARDLHASDAGRLQSHPRRRRRPHRGRSRRLDLPRRDQYLHRAAPALRDAQPGRLSEPPRCTGRKPAGLEGVGHVRYRRASTLPGLDVARLVIFGLYALQHRGQESAGHRGRRRRRRWLATARWASSPASSTKRFSAG